MKINYSAVVTVALATVLAACGSSGTSSTATTASSPASSSNTSDEAAIKKTFHDYNQALLARDFTTACTLLAPETKTKLVDNVKAQAGAVGTCEQAFSTIYNTPGAAEQADSVSKSANVQSVAATGDTATITISAPVPGSQQTVTVSNQMRRVDGQWRIVQ